MPSARGLSGPTTVRSIFFSAAKAANRGKSSTPGKHSTWHHSASRSWPIPALPGAHQICVACGDWASFHTKACSRPPEPITSIFMKKRRSAYAKSRPKNSLLIAAQHSSAGWLQVPASLWPPDRHNEPDTDHHPRCSSPWRTTISHRARRGQFRNRHEHAGRRFDHRAIVWAKRAATRFRRPVIVPAVPRCLP